MSYIKHEWESGDILYANQLNEMDTQIAANEAKTNELSEENAELKRNTSIVYISYDPTSKTYTCDNTFEELKEIGFANLQVCYYDTLNLSAGIIGPHYMRSIYIQYVVLDTNTGATYFEFVFLNHSLDGYIRLRFNSDNTIVKIVD